MNVKHLRYFYWVAKLGSYSRAAQHVEVTEPWVYRAVRALENSCGIQLLTTDKGKVMMTHAGRTLYDYAEKIDALERAAEQSITELVTPRHDALVFGLTQPMAHVAAPHIASWKAERPGLRLDMVVGRRRELYVRLLAGELDLALAVAEDLPEGLRADENLLYDEITFIGPRGHPLSHRRSVSPSELLRERLISPFPETTFHSLLAGMTADLDGAPDVSVRVDDGASVVQLVAAGAGIGLVSKYVAAQAIQLGKLSPITVAGFPNRIPYRFMFRANSAPSEDCASLVSFLSARLGVVSERSGRD